MKNFNSHTIFGELSHTPELNLGPPLEKRKAGLEMGISVLAALALLFWVPQTLFVLEVR